jgi:NAD(P)-dependent dehydrogenase (short-subunit alcohol dehydrogenase family)
VNVASVLGEFGIPHMSSYVAAKHAVVGFSDSLRQELRGSGIRVCTILPFSIDTPFYANSGNYTGRLVVPVPPVYPPERVAKEIVTAAGSGQEYVFVPALAGLLGVARAVSPALTELVANFVINQFQISSRTMPHTHGNLYAPNVSRRQATGGGKPAHTSRTASWTVATGVGLVLASIWYQFRPTNR